MLAGRIADIGLTPAVTWQPERYLRAVLPEEARYSRGFLCFRPEEVVKNLGKHWLQLFHALNLELPQLEMAKGFVVPSVAQRSSVIEIEGENGLLCWDQAAIAAITGVVAGEVAAIPQGLLIEYFERRLLSAMRRSWALPEQLRLYYVADKDPQDVDVLGVVECNFALGSEQCRVWFGLGPRTVERLDAMWRRQVNAERRQSLQTIDEDRLYNISIEIAELAVPPALLIDYLRGGTLIDLEVPVGASAVARIDEVPWISGELCFFHGNFALKVQQTKLTPRVLPEGTTRVRIELAHTELDNQAVFEYQQQGAILLTRHPLSASGALVIGGENVAEVIVHELDGRFAVSILPR